MKNSSASTLTERESKAREVLAKEKRAVEDIAIKLIEVFMESSE